MQRTKNYSGIVAINTQDVALQEGMGPIVERSGEHLAQTDRVIILLRRLLFEAMADVERGATPQGVDPASYQGVRAATRVIPAGSDWRRSLVGFGHEVLIARQRAQNRVAQERVFDRHQARHANDLLGAEFGS